MPRTDSSFEPLLHHVPLWQPSAATFVQVRIHPAARSHAGNFEPDFYSLFTTFCSIAEMRNKLAAAEALNGYLRVRLHRLQQKECSSGGVCSSSTGGSSLGGYSSNSNEPSIDNCRVLSLQQGEHSFSGSHELWSVACDAKSAADPSNNSFRIAGGEVIDGVVAVMSSHGKFMMQ